MAPGRKHPRMGRHRQARRHRSGRVEPWHCGALKRLYAAAPINRFDAPRLTIADRSASIEIDAKDDFHHAAAGVHGSVYFKALDDACFFAANSIVPDVFVLTAQFDLTLEAPFAAGTMRATAHLTEQGNRSLKAAGELHVDGKRVAHGRGVFVPSKHRLEDLVAALG